MPVYYYYLDLKRKFSRMWCSLWSVALWVNCIPNFNKNLCYPCKGLYTNRDHYKEAGIIFHLPQVLYNPLYLITIEMYRTWGRLHQGYFLRHLKRVIIAVIAEFQQCSNGRETKIGLQQCSNGSNGLI